MRIDLHRLARQIAQQEGGKVNLPIAQVKEVLSIALCLLSQYPDEVIRDAIRRSSQRRSVRGAS
jgi:hypothetical protein